jgi:hypothetical protein
MGRYILQPLSLVVRFGNHALFSYHHRTHWNLSFFPGYLCLLQGLPHEVCIVGLQYSHLTSA